MSDLSFFNQFIGLVLKYSAISFAVFGLLFIFYCKFWSRVRFRVGMKLFISKSYLCQELGLKDTLILNTFVNLFRFIFFVLAGSLIMFLLLFLVK